MCQDSESCLLKTQKFIYGEAALHITRRIARCGGSDGFMVSRLRGFCLRRRHYDRDFQPRTSRRRLLLHAVGIRHQLCL